MGLKETLNKPTRIPQAHFDKQCRGKKGPSGCAASSARQDCHDRGCDNAGTVNQADLAIRIDIAFHVSKTRTTQDIAKTDGSTQAVFT